MNWFAASCWYYIRTTALCCEDRRFISSFILNVRKQTCKFLSYMKMKLRCWRSCCLKLSQTEVRIVFGEHFMRVGFFIIIFFYFAKIDPWLSPHCLWLKGLKYIISKNDSLSVSGIYLKKSFCLNWLLESFGKNVTF